MVDELDDILGDPPADDLFSDDADDSDVTAVDDGDGDDDDPQDVKMAKAVLAAHSKRATKQAVDVPVDDTAVSGDITDDELDAILDEEGITDEAERKAARIAAKVAARSTAKKVAPLQQGAMERVAMKRIQALGVDVDVDAVTAKAKARGVTDEQFLRATPEQRQEFLDDIIDAEYGRKKRTERKQQGIAPRNTPPGGMRPSGGSRGGGIEGTREYAEMVRGMMEQYNYPKELAQERAKHYLEDERKAKGARR